MKHKIIISVLLCLMLLGCILGYLGYSEQNRVYAFQNALSMSFIDDVSVVEYGSEVDEITFVKDYTGGISTYEHVDAYKVGYQQLGYTSVFLDEKYGMTKQDFFHTVQVVDTQYPIITFKEESVSLGYKATFDPKNNIESVIDVVDGELEYQIIHSVNTSTSGNYEVLVQAMDKNGLMSSKSFQVVVGERIVVEASYNLQDHYSVDNKNVWNGLRFESFKKCMSDGYDRLASNGFHGRFSCSILYRNGKMTDQFALECSGALADKC